MAQSREYAFHPAARGPRAEIGHMRDYWAGPSRRTAWGWNVAVRGAETCALHQGRAQGQRQREIRVFPGRDLFVSIRSLQKKYGFSKKQFFLSGMYNIKTPRANVGP